MRDFAHQNVLVFCFLGGFLQLATAKGPGRILTQNTPKHVVPPKYVPFWGHEHKIYHLDPHFPELVPFWGPFLTGLRKFSPKNRLTIQYNTIHKIFIERDYTELSRGANKTRTLKTG